MESNRPAIRLPVPSKTKILFVLSCFTWYLTSALASSTSKALLSAPKHKPFAVPHPAHLDGAEIAAQVDAGVHYRQAAPFPYPVTLTFVQFLFVHVLSHVCASERILGKHKLATIIPPTKERIVEVGQLSLFTVVGHALSSVAISRVPVSTVHTIKALSPLFTVLAYSLFFSVVYSRSTWASLLPLTLGVMMACTSLSLSASDLIGLLAALLGTIIFVAQNIYSKQLLSGGGEEKNAGVSTGAKATKLDKINILLYSSGCAAIMMIPMVLYYDGASLFAGQFGASSRRILLLLASNGIVHFTQSLLAFSVLALVSPVTYSVANLLKRVFVICFAIVWFRQSVSLLQWMGIVLTFTGLYMYNNVKANKSPQHQETTGGPAPLPTSAKEDTFVNQSRVQASGREYGENGLTPTSARFNHLTKQPHMSVSKISGSYESKSNGVSGPGSWMRMNGGLRSPTGIMNGQGDFKGR